MFNFLVKIFLDYQSSWDVLNKMLKNKDSNILKEAKLLSIKRRTAKQMKGKTEHNKPRDGTF